MGHERGHQRSQYLQVCQLHKYDFFACFSVFTTRFVCLCAFTGRLWQCRDVWWGMRVALYSEWVTCEAVESSGHIDICLLSNMQITFDITSKPYVLSNHCSQVRDGPKHSSCRLHKSSEKKNEDSK